MTSSTDTPSTLNNAAEGTDALLASGVRERYGISRAWISSIQALSLPIRPAPTAFPVETSDTRSGRSRRRPVGRRLRSPTDPSKLNYKQRWTHKYSCL
jgi:hypothetical protein